jgi:hypothetical protein
VKCPLEGIFIRFCSIFDLIRLRDGWVARGPLSIGRYKRVIGDALRSRTDQTEAAEVAIAAAALNRMLELGRPDYVRIA